MSSTGTYKDYAANPQEHIKLAERYSETGLDLLVRSEALAQVYATLALAHANIALAQMQGAMRA